MPFRRWRLLRVLLLVLALASCRHAADGEPARDDGTSTAAVAYLVRPPDEYVLKRAFDPAPGRGLEGAEPSLTWFAEYEGPPLNAPQRVRLSGHAGDKEALGAELTGFRLEPAKVGQHLALMGRGPDSNGPSVVVFSIDREQSAMALSYELSAEDLVAWGSTLTSVDQAGWIAAGGVVQR